MTSKKNIVFITPGFPKDEADTTCLTALQIYCKELSKRADMNIRVVTLHYPNITSNYNWFGITIIPLGFNHKRRLQLFANHKVRKVLSKMHAATPIDVLHSFWLRKCAYIGHYFSKKHRIHHVTTLMGQDAKKRNLYAKLLPIKKMILVTLSSFHQEVFLKNYHLKLLIISWGIDANSRLFTMNKTIEIIGVGSMIELKNYTAFIKTIYLVKKEFPNIIACLIGSGKMKDQLIDQISELGLSNTIKVYGKLSYFETQRLLSTSKILLHPSNYESFGMVFAEALAHRTNIVSKKVGIAMADDNWFIGKTPEEFAHGCCMFLRQGIMTNRPFPSIEKTVSEYVKLYNN